MTEAFVSAVLFGLLPENFERVSSEAAQFAQGATPRIQGLIEIALLGNKERTRLLILSRWESEDAWARSRWDQEVGKTMVELIENAKTFSVETFVPIRP
jgi:heme-degrading monooxygenase HmoA